MTRSVADRDCVIAGGGPAGMMLGILLARAGLRVTVLERHADFLRDFRGDTIHPSTITLLGELGLRERFLALPVTRVDALDVVLDGIRLTAVDFRRLPEPDDFLVLAPQWELLDFLAREGARHPGFDLRMSTSATDLVVEDGVVRGVRAATPEGDLEIRAALTVAADGRSSTLRAAAGLEPRASGVPIDVLWFHLPVPESAPPDTLAYAGSGGAVLTIPRRAYYQAGTIIEKGGFPRLRAAGMDALRTRIAGIAPVLDPVVGALRDWDQIKLLSVQIDRLPTWCRPGFIAIGDAAHAMSPVGGVGVNYAIQDAVALANAVARPLRAGPVDVAVLAAVQARRERPVARMQRFQRLAHRLIARAAAGSMPPRPVFRLVRLLAPLVRGSAARFVGIGILPEHVDPGILS